MLLLTGIKARKEVKLVLELPVNCPVLYNSLFTQFSYVSSFIIVKKVVYL